MVIIGGLGSIMGSLMGAAFMVLLPEVVQVGADALAGSAIDRALKLGSSISFLREMAVGRRHHPVPDLRAERDRRIAGS